ncbi:MAG: GNVR domain-containing protein [Limnothrix sp.]
MSKALPSRSVSSALRRYWWAATIALITSLGTSALYLLSSSSLYEASARLSVNDSTVSLSEVGQTLTDNKEIGGADPIVTQAELVKSQRVLKRGLESYASQSASKEVLPDVKQLQKDIQVRIIPATTILELTYISENPEQVASLLNAIVEAAVAENTEFIRQEASTVVTFLEGQIPIQATKLARIEQVESQYRQENSLVSEGAQNEELIRGVAALEQEERSLAAALDEAITRTNQLQQVIGVTAPESAYTAAQVGQDPQLNELSSQIIELEAELSEARSRLGDEHPDLLALLDQQADLYALFDKRSEQLTGTKNGAEDIAVNELSQDLIAEYIRSDVEVDTINARLKNVRLSLDQLRRRAANQPLLQRPLAGLVREKEEAASSLKLLQGKLEEARLAEAQLNSNIRIVGQAELPEEAIGPKPAAILIIGLFAGSVLAASVVLLLDLLDTSLQNSQEVEKLVNLPVLGNLKQMPADLVRADGLAAFLDNSDWVEPYRSLLNNIESEYLAQDLSKLSQTDEKSLFTTQTKLNHQSPKTIVLSSIGESEGKSTVILCLGAVASMLGRRTVIVEVDPYSSVHEYLQTPSQPGLTNVIYQQRALTDVIQLTALNQLSVIPYGQLPDRPASLLGSEAIWQLLAQLKEEYDLVLIDASPAGISADATTLSQFTDGLVLVVRPNFTPRDAVSETVEQLRRGGARLLGIALNRTVLLKARDTTLPIAAKSNH